MTTQNDLFDATAEVDREDWQAPLELRDSGGGQNSGQGNSNDNDNDDGDAAANAVAELRQSVENFERRAEERISTEINRIGERVGNLETRLNRPNIARQPNTSEDQGAAEMRAFETYCRYGREALSADEVRTLQVGAATGGETLVPENFLQEIIRNLVEFSPMRQVARVSQASGSNVTLPRRTAGLTAGWVAEGDPSSSSEPTYNAHSIDIYEARVYSDISNALLEDSAFDMAAELARDFAEEFGRLEGKAFIDGNGTSQPEGLLTSSDFVTETGGSDLADDLIDLYHAVPSAYARRGAWGMNRATMAEVRKLKTSGTGVYLWADSLTPGNPPTLLGRPVVEFPDLPDLSQSPVGVPIVFGDWATGYRIFDRVGLSVLRDPFSRSTNSEVRFLARRRVGGKLVQPEALRGLET